MSNHRVSVNIRKSPGWHSRQEIKRLEQAILQLNKTNTEKIRKLEENIGHLKRMTNITELQRYIRHLMNVRYRINEARRKGHVTFRRGPGA